MWASMYKLNYRITKGLLSPWNVIRIAAQFNRVAEKWLHFRIWQLNSGEKKEISDIEAQINQSSVIIYRGWSISTENVVKPWGLYLILFTKCFLFEVLYSHTLLTLRISFWIWVCSLNNNKGSFSVFVSPSASCPYRWSFLASILFHPKNSWRMRTCWQCCSSSLSSCRGPSSRLPTTLPSKLESTCEEPYRWDVHQRFLYINLFSVLLVENSVLVIKTH